MYGNRFLSHGVRVIDFTISHLSKKQIMLKKNSLIILAAVCSYFVVNAQVNGNTVDSAAHTKTRTLWGALSPSVHSVGIYVAPELQYIAAAGTNAPAAGLSGMLMLNQRFSFGLTASHSRSFIPKDLNNDGLRMRYGFGAAQLEYTFAPKSLFHVSIPLALGAGMARIDSLRSGRVFDNQDDRGHQPGGFGRGFDRNKPFFVVQPGLRVEANLSRYAKLYAGVNYRITTGSSGVSYPVGAGFETMSVSKLSGLNFSAGIKVGLFDYQLKKKNRS